MEKPGFEFRSFQPPSILLACSKKVLMNHIKSEGGGRRERELVFTVALFFSLVQNLHIFIRHTSLELASKQNPSQRDFDFCSKGGQS